MNTVERIKEIATQKGIAISKLEKECGFSNGYIRSLKKGTMPNDKIEVVADYFGVSINYLINGKDNNIPSFSQEHIELLSLYEKLDDKQKEAILLVMRSMIK